MRMGSIRRVDAISKAKGEQQYVGDLEFEDTQYAVLIRSTIARGKILKINLPNLPEGFRYFDERDIPEGGKNELWMIQKDWKCFAAGEVGYVGETIGILLGPDRDMLYKLSKQVEIEYQEETPAVSIQDGIDLKGGAIIGDDNVHCKLELSTGDDIDEAFKKADRIIEETIETGFQEHMSIETNGVIALWEDGKPTIYASSQCPFYIRKSVAGIINYKADDIIVKQMMTGGAFGGKEHFPDVLAGPALLATYITKKPVKLIFNREEETQFSVKRHPSMIKFRTAVDKKGDILGMDSVIYYNVGRYLASSFIVLQRGCFHVTGVYKFPSFRSKGFGIATNTFPSCAFRGFGAPQSIFAVETHMCHIAEQYGIDPIEYKKRYFIKKGDTTSTNGKVVENVKIPELLELVCKGSNYYQKIKKYKPGCGRGIGIALYNHGGAFTGDGESAKIKAHVEVKRHKDGSVSVYTGQTEMGQGIKTAMIKIAAKTLGIPVSKVKYEPQNTDLVPDSGPTAASRSVMVPGNLVQQACQKLKEKWAEKGEISAFADYKHPEGYPWDQDTFQGYAYIGYGWGACAVEVEVDKRTAEPKIVGIWSAHDVGNTIDSRVVHGQVNGGIAQGIGWASTELLENKDGHFKQHSMSDYIIPTSMDLPRQEVYYANEPYQWGPFGAKGMGELVFNGSGAAYIDALSRAIDRKISQIPVPTEKVMDYILHGETLAKEGK